MLQEFTGLTLLLTDLQKLSLKSSNRVLKDIVIVQCFARLAEFTKDHVYCESDLTHATLPL